MLLNDINETIDLFGVDLESLSEENALAVTFIRPIVTSILDSQPVSRVYTFKIGQPQGEDEASTPQLYAGTYKYSTVSNLLVLISISE